MRSCKDLPNGRTAVALMYPGDLAEVIVRGEINNGDLLDVFCGTIQVVSNNHIPSGVEGDYQVQTLTRNDSGELEIINYRVVDGKINEVSKRKGDMEDPRDRRYARKYDAALVA